MGESIMYSCSVRPYQCVLSLLGDSPVSTSMFQSRSLVLHWSGLEWDKTASPMACVRFWPGVWPREGCDRGGFVLHLCSPTRYNSSTIENTFACTEAVSGANNQPGPKCEEKCSSCFHISRFDWPIVCFLLLVNAAVQLVAHCTTVHSMPCVWLNPLQLEKYPQQVQQHNNHNQSPIKPYHINRQICDKMKYGAFVFIWTISIH